MSFFSKDQTEKNLQYDNIAFLHFLLTISITFSFVFGILVYKRLKQANVKNIKNYQKLKQAGLYTKQIQNEKKILKEKIITKNFYILTGLLIASIIASISIGYFVGSHQTQMIGFDPHQILGVDITTPVAQIKKAYRKLALEFHPDRNPNDPAAHAKFIMISKSYECLTDDKKKQNCLKYGNPDGQTSFEVGIGLPKFMIDKQNQYVILPIVFSIFLFLIPMLIIKWSSNLKATDSTGLDIANFPYLYRFYRPDFNASFGFYLVTVLKQLQSDKKLTEQQKSEFFHFLSEKRLVDMTYVSKQLNQSQIYTLHQLLSQMALKQPDADLSKRLPQLLNSLMKFSLIFAKRINDKKPLLGDQLPINWIGTQHIFMLLQFIRTFYNCSLFNPPYFQPFDYLDLEKQDYQISFKNPVASLKQILSSKDKRQQHLALFPEHHREYIERQLNDLPNLELDVKCKIGKQQVKQFTTQDFPEIVFKVKKLNQTSGYCFLKKFPYLKEEKYYFVLVYANNLIHFEQVTFEEGKRVYIGKFPYRQGIAKDMKFFAFLFSQCQYGIDCKAQLNFNVVEPKPDEAQKDIQYHKDDLYIQKQPKSYFQKMLTLQIQNPSDNQLSDTQDQQSSKLNKPKMQTCSTGCSHPVPASKPRKNKMQRQQDSPKKQAKSQHTHQHGPGCNHQHKKQQQQHQHQHEHGPQCNHGHKQQNKQPVEIKEKNN